MYRHYAWITIFSPFSFFCKDALSWCDQSPACYMDHARLIWYTTQIYLSRFLPDGYLSATTSSEAVINCIFLGNFRLEMIQWTGFSLLMVMVIPRWAHMHSDSQSVLASFPITIWVSMDPAKKCSLITLRELSAAWFWRIKQALGFMKTIRCQMNLIDHNWQSMSSKNQFETFFLQFKFYSAIKCLILIWNIEQVSWAVFLPSCLQAAIIKPLNVSFVSMISISICLV